MGKIYMFDELLKKKFFSTDEKEKIDIKNTTATLIAAQYIPLP
jgi:hypothetical protein